MELFWQNDETNLYVGLISPGTGWAGVGFSHRIGKPGSNIIIGAVSAAGQVTIRDGYGPGFDWSSRRGFRVAVSPIRL